MSVTTSAFLYILKSKAGRQLRWALPAPWLSFLHGIYCKAATDWPLEVCFSCLQGTNDACTHGMDVGHHCFMKGKLLFWNEPPTAVSLCSPCHNKWWRVTGASHEADFTMGNMIVKVYRDAVRSCVLAATPRSLFSQSCELKLHTDAF